MTKSDKESSARFSAAASVAIALVCAVVLAGDGIEEPPLAPLDTKEPIGFYVAPGKDSVGYRAGDKALAGWAIEAWQKASGGAFTIKPGTRDSAVLQLYWVSGRGGLYGEMVPIRIGEKRGAAVYVLPETKALGDDIARRAERDALFRDGVVYLTCLHELGHGLGLSHTDDYADIMYFFGYGGDVSAYFARYRKLLKSRSDIQRNSGLSKNDVRRLKEVYSRDTNERSKPEGRP